MKHLNKIWVMLKVYNKGICLWCCSGVFIVNFEHTSQPILVFLLLTLNMHLFTWMTVCYIVFIVIFSLMTHKRVRTYILIFQFFMKISAVDFRLFLKNCYNYYQVTLTKTSGCWHIFMWLLKLTILDIYIHPWLLWDNSDDCYWNSDRMYIYIVGCLNAYTVLACKLQWGCIYTSLARKGLTLLMFWL